MKYFVAEIILILAFGISVVGLEIAGLLSNDLFTGLIIAFLFLWAFAPFVLAYYDYCKKHHITWFGG